MTAGLLQSNERGLFYGTAALFALTLGIGGLGPHAPMLDALIAAAAFPVLVAIGVFGGSRSFSRPGGLPVLLFIVILLALGLCQLLPLPASMWRALPGRDVPGMVIETLGRGDRARPLSLAPEHTRSVLQSLLAPVTILLATMTAGSENRRRLAALVVLAAVLGSALGLLQLSFGDGTLFLYPTPPFDRFPGAFANFNHQAVFLGGAVALLPPLAWPRGRHGPPSLAWPAATWVLLCLGTLLTASRAGLVLFALATVVSGLRFQAARAAAPRQHGGGSRRTQMWLISAVALTAVAALAAGGYRTELMATRFEAAGSDLRLGFWRTTLAAIGTYLPFGSGLGTFESVYQIAEPLEDVGPFLVNHAHNDYLEFVLEAGLPGAVLLALFALWLALRVVGLVRRSSRERDGLAWSGLLIVLMIMLHSLVDYPLRTEALGCVFAFACGLLVVPPRTHAALASSADAARA